MKQLSIFFIVCLFFFTGSKAWGLDLPISGEYYVIKNYSSETYVGGSSAGNDNVVHEDGATNTDYHIFLVTGNNTDGYRFQQVESGYYIQHSVGNGYTMSYSTTQSLWILSDQSSYFNINRKGQNNGLGADNLASGSKLYSDKGESAVLPNKWNFADDGLETFYANLFNTLKIEAQDISGIMSSVASSALSDAINATATTVADYRSIVVNLKTAVSAAKTSIDAYKKLNHVIRIADASLVSTETGYEAVKTERDDAYAVYNAALSTDEDINAARLALETALLSYNTTNATNDTPKELSFAIPDYLVEGLNYWISDPSGAWNTTADYGDAPDNLALVMGRWHGSGTNSITFSQTVNGLPNGRYKLTTMVKTNGGNSSSTGSVVAGGQSSAVTYSSTWQEVEVTDIQLTDGSLPISITETSTYNNSWNELYIDNIKLTYYGASPYTAVPEISSDICVYKALGVPGGIYISTGGVEKNDKVNIYDVTGRIVKRVYVSNDNVFVPLNAGIYIVAQQKVVVK